MRPLPSLPIKTPKEQVKVIEEQYVQLCWRPGLSELQRRKDFWKLCTNPFIQSIGCRVEQKQLFLATTHVYLKDELDVLRSIGEFIIRIHWNMDNTVEFYFHNTTRTVGDPNFRCHHPHINDSGVMCMGSASFEVSSLLVERNIPDATDLMIAALYSLTSGQYSPAAIHKWPVVVVKGMNNA